MQKVWVVLCQPVGTRAHVVGVCADPVIAGIRAAARRDEQKDDRFISINEMTIVDRQQRVWVVTCETANTSTHIVAVFTNKERAGAVAEERRCRLMSRIVDIIPMTLKYRYDVIEVNVEHEPGCEMH